MQSEALTITTDPMSGITTYQIVGGYRFTLDPLKVSKTVREPQMHFEVALRAVAKLAAATVQAAGDVNLSDTGRNQRLDPIRKEAIETVARSSKNIGTFENLILADAAALELVPPLAADDVVGALHDGEIRAFWRAAPLDQRTALMRRVEAREPGADRIALALLRSPVPLDQTIDAMREVWAKTQRTANPAAAGEIVAGEVAIAWARRGMGHVIGILPQIAHVDRKRIEAILMASGDPNVHAGAAAFGVDPAALARMRLSTAA